MPAPAVVLYGEGNGGSLAGNTVLHLKDVEHDARAGGRLGGDGVRALDGSVEFQLALRNVALAALVVGNLRQIDVVCAGGEVHVVVAGAASRAVGILEPGIGLCGAGLRGGLVAELATPRVGGQTHCRPVGNALAVPDDLIGFAGNHAGQFVTHVDLVSHHRHVHRVPGVGIDGLRRVAHDAEIQTDARAAVERERIVALIAARRADYVPGVGGHAARRNPGRDLGIVIRAQIELGQVARTVDADAMGESRIPRRRLAFGLGRECIDVFAVGHLLGGPAGIRARLNRRHLGDGAGLRARGVGVKLRLPLRDVRTKEAHRDGARRGDSVPIQGQSFGVGNLVIDTDRAVLRNIGRDDRHRQAGTNEIHGRFRGVISLVVRRKCSLFWRAHQNHGTRDHYQRQCVSTNREHRRGNPHTYLQIISNKKNYHQACQAKVPRHSPRQTPIPGNRTKKPFVMWVMENPTG